MNWLMLNLKNRGEYIGMESIISSLVIGKSGAGKSEFILSFIDDEQRKWIPASGEGQTTRTSMRYEIDFRQKGELAFDIEVKSKKEFVDERMAVVERYFQDEENEIIYFKNDDTKNVFIEDLMQKLILDDAFFNCKEFDSDTNSLSEEIQDMFKKNFAGEFWTGIEDDLFNSVGKDESVEEFDKKFSTFFGKVYELCRDCIPLKKQRVLVKNAEDLNIELYLKVNEEGKSYSALIKNISIVAYGNDIYRDIMERLKIDKLVLIDTYGLDHAEQLGEKMLEKRYAKLLREEYSEVKSVFYLRNIAAPGSPSDLTTGITTIFKVEPSIVPYVIFTFWDKVYEDKNPDGYKSTKAYKAIETIKSDIQKKLLKENISSSLIKNRINELLNTRIAYASKTENVELKDLNMKNMSKVLQSVRFSKHLGAKYIPVKLLDVNNVGSILSVNNLLKSRDLHGYPSATKGAIRRRIQPESERFLGFDSSTVESVLWTDIIANDLNNRFCNVIKNYKWKEYLLPQVGESNYSEIINAVEEIFLKLSRILYLGATNSVSDVNTSCYGNLIIKNLYEEQKQIIDSGVCGSVGDYLSNIYNFSNISSETKNKIQEIIIEAYSDYYIPECRKHNARKIAELITEDTTWKQKEDLLNDYYSQCEREEITEDEKIEFESLVSDYVVV